MAVYLEPGAQLPSIVIRILMAVRELACFMQCKRSMTISIDQQGRRFYLRGNTYPVKDALRSAGCKWDPDARCWYTGKRELAEQCAQGIIPSPVASSGPSPASLESIDDWASAAAASPASPGDDAVVAGRATYKGQTYYVAGRVDRGRTHYDDHVQAVTTRDGAKMLLYSRDGKLQFWAGGALVSITKSYDRPQTIGGLHRFAAKAKEARAQGYEDGIAEGQRYECAECGDRVTRGQGSCWETGCAH
jgi:hypothetical protein